MAKKTKANASEDRWIEYVRTRARASKNTIMPIGDDAAVLKLPPGHQLVVSTDALVEGVHFLKNKISAEDLGWKSLAVNLSDMAAMGAKPQWAVLSLSLPSQPSAWSKGFLKGFLSLAKRHGVELVGRDTTSSKRDIFINVTVGGCARVENLRYRHTVREGDWLCVTGPVGLSRAGLQLQSKKTKGLSNVAFRHLLKAHHRPVPRVDEGQWLATQSGVHAMMDVSDGVLKDAHRLMRASEKALVIDVDRLPISKEQSEYYLRSKRSPIEEPLLGGEDYELLFTLEPISYEMIAAQYQKKFKSSLYVIGQVTAGSPEVLGRVGRDVMSLSQLKPFEHF